MCLKRSGTCSFAHSVLTVLRRWRVGRTVTPLPSLNRLLLCVLVLSFRQLHQPVCSPAHGGKLHRPPCCSRLLRVRSAYSFSVQQCTMSSSSASRVEEDAEQGSPPTELNTSGNLAFVDVSV